MAHRVGPGVVVAITALVLSACSRPGPPPSASANTAPPTVPSPPSEPVGSAASSSATNAEAPLRTGNLEDVASLGLAPAKRRIVTVTTALKPGGPSEVIEANETNDGAVLRVRRLHHDDRIEEESAKLTPAELNELWQLVKSEKLESATPPATDPGVMDGASHTVVLEWPEAGRTRVHAFHFENPKQRNPGLDRLFRKMGELARAKLGSVKLHYYP